MFLTAGLALGLTLISGIADAYGFTHAARTWRNDSLVASELAKASLGFLVGVAAYVLVLRYLGQLGVRSAIPQTLGWFGVTIVGVALLTGELAQWSRTDEMIGGLTALGVAWLLISSGS